MRNPISGRHALAFLSACGALVIARAALACESDSDCKGSRVCVKNKCVEPSSDDAPAPVSKSKKKAAQGGDACARDTDCPGDEECVSNVCREPASSHPAAPAPSRASDSAPSGGGYQGYQPGSRTASAWMQPFEAGVGQLATWAFADLGLFYESVSTPFGSSSSTKFGITGQLHMLYGITTELSVGGVGELGLVPQDSGMLLPISLFAVANYQRAGPLKLIGGLGFTFAPWLGGATGSPSSESGFALLVEAIYPVPSSRFSAMGRISLHLLSDSLTIWVFTVGGGYAF